jgi:hypothetical protein
MWLNIANIRNPAMRVAEIKRILKEELPASVVINIQYLVKVSPDATLGVFFGV